MKINSFYPVIMTEEGILEGPSKVLIDVIQVITPTEEYAANYE